MPSELLSIAIIVVFVLIFAAAFAAVAWED